MKKSRVKKYLAALAVVLVAGFILYMSSLTAVESDAISIGIGDRILQRIYPGFSDMSGEEQAGVSLWFDNLIRETAHFVEFGVLGACLMNLIRRWPMAFASGVVIAIADECLQLFVEGRSFQLLDLGLDTAGVLAGCMIIKVLIGMRGRRT